MAFLLVATIAIIERLLKFLSTLRCALHIVNIDMFSSISTVSC